MGYENERLAEVVFRKTALYRNQLRDGPSIITLSDTPALFVAGLAWHPSEPLRVLDFGGACGAHYFLMRALFPPARVAFRWHVVETQTMARRARELEDAELRFFDSLPKAVAALGPIDVVFASGALQCVPDPYQCLADLLACGGRYLALTRVGCTRKGEPLIIIHHSRLSENGPGPMPADLADGIASYPFTFPVAGVVESLITSRYTVLLETKDESGCFPVNNEPLIGRGYVAERRPDSEGHVGLRSESMRTGSRQ